MIIHSPHDVKSKCFIWCWCSNWVFLWGMHVQVRQKSWKIMHAYNVMICSLLFFFLNVYFCAGTLIKVKGVLTAWFPVCFSVHITVWSQTGHCVFCQHVESANKISEHKPLAGLPLSGCLSVSLPSRTSLSFSTQCAHSAAFLSLTPSSKQTQTPSDGRHKLPSACVSEKSFANKSHYYDRWASGWRWRRGTSPFLLSISVWFSRINI